MPILQQIGGWKPWFYAKTIRYDPDLAIEFKTASAPFPPSYLPSRSFWAETFSTHCLLPTPWSFLNDAYSAFVSLASTGGLIGALEGSAMAGVILQDAQFGSWGIGREQAFIPQVGFCIGDKYKEHAYFYISVVKLILNSIVASSCIDVFQRSRLKRIYVAEGLVTSCVPDPTVEGTLTTEYILTIDLEGVIPEGLTTSIEGDTLKVYKKDGSIVNLKMKNILPDWKITVTITSDITKIPGNGDFYKFDTPLCIEDPYMMSGFLHDPKPFGPYTLDYTSHNYPYIKEGPGSEGGYTFNAIEFVGFYVYREKDVEEGENDIEIAPSEGSAFIETETHEWSFYYYEGVKSQIYDENKYRYYNVESIAISDQKDHELPGDYISPTMKKFADADPEDLKKWKEIDDIKYVRMEINVGGDSERQNWHSPILTKCWFKQGEKYFAILGQPDGNVIDISLRDVTNTTDLNTDKGKGGSILNQYAWMINEHYTQCGGQDGFLEGNIDSATYEEKTDTTTITWKSKHLSYGTIYGFDNWDVASPNPNSFYNRFISSHDGSLKKMWKKFQYWRVYNESYKTSFAVDPSSIEISGPDADKISVTSEVICKAKVYGDMRGSTRAGFYFDTPYDRSGSTLLPIYIYDIQQGMASGSPLPTLCVDWRYRTAIMEIQIPTDTRIGSTGAQWWGLGARGLNSVLSNDNLDLFVTVLSSAKTISSFYHYVRQQDWIFFQDKNTNRLTLRRGNVDFTESPRREEVIIGLPESTGSAESFPITFDTTKERVKLISMEIPEESDFEDSDDNDDFAPSALTFQIDNKSDYFGFTSTGSGIFDFMALRDNGLAPGTVDYSKYKSQDNFISPVYIYTKRTDNVNLHNNNTLELGIDTKVKLLVKNGSPSNIKIQYVNNNQTLINMGYFDVHHINDGEVMTVYGKNVNKFEKNMVEYDPEGTWPTKECVFIIGTSDNSLTWGLPNVKTLILDGDSDYQYPVMVINSCNYITSCYHRISERIFIIMKCYQKEDAFAFTPFIGCYTVNRITLSENIEICNADPDNVVDPELNFWYRKSLLPSNILTDNERNPVPTDISLSTEALNIDNYSFDSFVRVLGPAITKSAIKEEIGNIGILSIFILTDGTTVILYSGEGGIRMLSSHDAVGWNKSKIIIARSGDSAVLVSENLFYITSEGIMMKSDMDENMCMASRATMNAGYDDEEIEILQKTFDSARTLLIGSGKIVSQRLSGHISHDGVHKIMYYNSDGILCCLESKDTLKWAMASNF